MDSDIYKLKKCCGTTFFFIVCLIVCLFCFYDCLFVLLLLFTFCCLLIFSSNVHRGFSSWVHSQHYQSVLIIIPLIHYCYLSVTIRLWLACPWFYFTERNSWFCLGCQNWWPLTWTLNLTSPPQQHIILLCKNISIVFLLS